MAAVVGKLDGLPQAPESIIVRSFYDAIKADSRLSMFTWRLIELPDPSQMPAFAVYTAVVSPAAVRIVDWPSQRETIRPECVVGFVVPWEQTNEDSKLYGLRLLNVVLREKSEIAQEANQAAD